ncbi:MAG: amino acid ABC transporter permease [Holosporaceae bacterium]|jgi:polar amino acid transport system permease protein|nr:amino acid ABC transporter permease [Holosporaceae bacterium]
MEKIISNIVYVASGIPATLELLLGGVVLGFTIGTVFSIMRYSGICSWFISGFISIIRGTPVILQLSLVYFALPALMGVRLNLLTAGIIAFGLNSSAYVAEILRSGIESIPKGQFEAAKTLGIPVFPMWKDIIMPQIVRNVFPAMVNEIIALLKETALIATIGGMDIMKMSQSIAAEQFEYFVPLCIAGGYYYSLVLFIEYIGKKVEKEMSYVKNS